MKRIWLPFFFLFLLQGCNEGSSAPADEPPPVADAPPAGDDMPPDDPFPPAEPEDPPPPAAEDPPPAEDPPAVSATRIDARQVADALGQVTAWQLANPVEHDPRKWMMGALYSGLVSAGEALGDAAPIAGVLGAGAVRSRLARDLRDRRDPARRRGDPARDGRRSGRGSRRAGPHG